MAVADLTTGTRRTRGRPPKPVEVEFVRDLSEADLALLASGRGVQAPSIKRLRDRHHALARLLAQGMSASEASAVTGYDPSRISILKKDPTFAELVDHYRKVDNALMAEFTERATLLTLTAMDVLQEAAENDELTVGQALEISKTFADRTGHAPVTKVQQTNINVDLGSRLAAARSRIATPKPTPQLPVFDAEFSEVAAKPLGTPPGGKT